MAPKKELEQTLILLKPDALKLSLTGYILSQLSEFHSGLRFAGMKIVHVSRMLAQEHYYEHQGKFFYPPLIDYIMGKLHYPDAPHKRRVVALVYSGPDAVKKIREMAGPTNPHDARDKKPGTIRAFGTIVPVRDAQGKIIGERMDNLVHASSSDPDAEREVKLWFKHNDIMPYMRAYPAQTCEEHYYYKDGRLFTEHEPGSVCILAPGDSAWESDLDLLHKLLKGKVEGSRVETVVAKYLINEHREE
jgi:nucleoside-diphosphate kinase